jgi:hypothetical protein
VAARADTPRSSPHYIRLGFKCWFLTLGNSARASRRSRSSIRDV